MNKNQIIKEVEDWLHSTSLSTMIKSSETFDKITHNQISTFSISLSNTQPTDTVKSRSFKLDNINDAVDIGDALHDAKTTNKLNATNSAIQQFDLDINSDIFIIIKIQ